MSDIQMPVASQHQILTHRTHLRLIRGKSVLTADDSFRALLTHSAPCRRKPSNSQYSKCTTELSIDQQHSHDIAARQVQKKEEMSIGFKCPKERSSSLFFDLHVSQYS